MPVRKTSTSHHPCVIVQRVPIAAFRGDWPFPTKNRPVKSDYLSACYVAKTDVDRSDSIAVSRKSVYLCIFLRPSLKLDARADGRVLWIG
jgi:hypothetical protein